MLHNRQTLWQGRFSVGVHIYIIFIHVLKVGVRHVTARKGIVDLSVQLYSGSVSIDHISGTFAQRSCDVQY